ncbi:hypothetical protein KSP39_PZI002805 [Platanthera zijinensis]|uniref:Uncharacterized protein n=1 Tax=Platanthera zijinensis TaxID=2320716 RepID=A0AAP0BZQ3_9ASPA
MNWGQQNIPLMQGIQNGLTYSQDHGKSMSLMGHVPGQLEQSMHGTPVSNDMEFLNHYLLLPEMSNDCKSVELIQNTCGIHTKRTSKQLFTFNHFRNDQLVTQNEAYSSATMLPSRKCTPGKTLFDNDVVQSTHSDVSESIQQLNHSAGKVHVQRLQNCQEQTDWLVNSHENSLENIVSSRGATSIDPLEKKILFGVDCDANLDVFPDGRSNRLAKACLDGYPISNNDFLDVSPSHRTGTWTALMQEALTVSSSDADQHEDWSGWGIQNDAEPPPANPNFFSEGYFNLQNAPYLTSNPVQLFSEANASPNRHSISGPHQPIKISYEQSEKFHTGQQLSKQTSDALFVENHQPYYLIGSSLPQKQELQQNIPNDLLEVQMQQQTKHYMESSERRLNSPEVQHSWIHQQKTCSHNINSQSTHELTDWEAELPPSCEGQIFKDCQNVDMNLYAQNKDATSIMHREMYHERRMGQFDESKGVSWNSHGEPEFGKSETNILKMSSDHTYDANFTDFLNPITFRSNVVMNHQKQMSICPQDWDSSTSGHFGLINIGQKPSSQSDENAKEDSYKPVISAQTSKDVLCSDIQDNSVGMIPTSRIDSLNGNGARIPTQCHSEGMNHSEMINAISNQRNTSQRHPDAETVSTNLPFTSPVLSKGGFSNLFNNVLKNAAIQHLPGLQPQKLTCNLLQSMNPLQPSPQEDDQIVKEIGISSSEIGTHSINSQQFTFKEEIPPEDTNSEQKHAMSMEVSAGVVSTSQAEEQDSKNISVKNSVVSISSLVHLHQQDITKGKNTDNKSGNVTFPTVPPSNNDVQKHNYSLLQQLQAMKGIGSASSMVHCKILSGTECNGDASTVELAGSEGYICELNAAYKKSDATSRVNGEKSYNASAHLHVGELASHRPTSSPRQDNCFPVNAQMAPPLFEQYRAYKENQTSDSLGSSLTASKVAQKYFSSKTFDPVENAFMVKKRDDNISDISSFSVWPPRKKLKISKSDLFPWLNDVKQGSPSLLTFSMAKTEWTGSTNRQVDEVVDDIETVDDVPNSCRPKRRLILTSQLIQQIFPHVDAKLMLSDARTSYDKVIYYMTKLTLGKYPVQSQSWKIILACG